MDFSKGTYNWNQLLHSSKKKKKISCYFLALSLVVDIKVSESAIGSEDDKISYSFWALSIFVYLWRRRWVFSLLLSFCFCGGWFGFDFSWGVFFVFKISMNGERPIPIFWSCFSSIFFFFVLFWFWEERYLKGE